MTQNVLTTTTPSGRTRVRSGLELVATGVVLAAAGASGAALLAVSATGRWEFQTLVLHIGVPAAGVLAWMLITAPLLRFRRLGHAIILGWVAGIIATLGLEVVRIIGFRVFHSMPGDLPTLMGVKLAGRIMLGPNTMSTTIGYLDHFWNGAMFGVVFAVLIGGFPAVRGAFAGAVIGAAYGLALGFGFVAGPLPRTLGIGGVFSSVTVAEFHITVYAAHAVFGAMLGVLVHRFGARIPPLWILVRSVLRARSDRRPPDIT